MPMIFDKNTAKKYLYDVNRGYNNRLTWGQQYGNIDYSAQVQKQQNVLDYSEAINQAYAAANNQQVSIYNSNLGEGYKRSLIEQNRAELDKAYSSYMSNLQQANAEVDQYAMSYADQISKLADEQAQGIVDAANSNIDYYLYVAENAPELLQNNPNYSKYLVDDLTMPVLNEDGEQIIGEDGKPVYEKRAMNRTEIMNRLFDANGNLTWAGVDFFDQLQNDRAVEDSAYNLLSYNDWLFENDRETFDFLATANPYEYNYWFDEEGNLRGDASNMGSFRTMTGRVSDDYTYKFAERFGGMSETELKDLFKPFEQLANLDIQAPDAISQSWKADFARQSMDSIDKLLNELDLVSVLETEGVNYSDFKNQLNKLFTDVDKANAEISDAGNDCWRYAVGGAGIGALAGSAFPAVGNVVGAIVGLFVGAIGGVVSGEVRKANAKSSKSEAEKQINEAYIQMVNQLVNVSLSERRKKELEFNQKYGL